jgi:peptidyl-dipeptidase A
MWAHMNAHPLTVAYVALLLAAPAFAQGQKAAPSAATAEAAKAFAKQANDELKRLWTLEATADWVRQTNITDDTERLATFQKEAVMEYLTRVTKDAVKLEGVKGLDPDTQRFLYLIRTGSSLPAPSDATKRSELAEISTRLDSMYGKGKWCGKGYTPGSDAVEDAKRCKDLPKLEAAMTKAGSYEEQLEAWVGWHSISPPMRPLYEKLVNYSNLGAKEIGFQDLGDLWRAGYDMPSPAFEAEVDRLWGQVKPMYDQLHCYVRSQLVKKYGEKKVPPQGPIPAHLLGNMWAQQWSNLYKLVEPYKGQKSGIDVTAALKAKKYDHLKMVRTAEGFFTSLGMPSLPETFYKRSMFVQPKDREVVCHASAWDVTFSNDLRIKMCIKVDAEDFETIHHELGHNYYYAHYYTLPALYQKGANDGFHEAIGDALTLSMTPSYFQKLGLIAKVPPTDEKAVINRQMNDALAKIAFLPFGRLMDQWRWDVFSGKVPASQYNAHWWTLRQKYQGVAAPVARTEEDFDPGAKYHIPGNVPYMRYFLAFILQFQFHRSLCQAAGYDGPLHECSIYGNKAAGAKLAAMLRMGASKPWPEALQALTGQKEMDATAILDYFKPLTTWLETQNKGQKCGW